MIWLAQGNYKNAIFPWGDKTNLLDSNANTWQGNFPVNNESIDGYEMIAPVKSFPKRKKTPPFF